MEKDKNLQYLFDSFKENAPEVLSIHEIESGLNQIKKTRIKTYKNIMYTTIISGLILGVSILVIKSNSADIIIAFQENNIEIIKPKLIQDRIYDTSSIILNSTENISTLKPKKLYISNYKTSNNNTYTYTRLPIDTIKTQFHDSINSIVAINDTFIQPETKNILTLKQLDFEFIKLNREELYKLGIVCKDNGIFYQETFNTKKPYKFSKIKVKNTESITHQGGSIKILSNLDKYPKLITNFEITSASGVLNRSSLEDTLEILNNYLNYFPVAVSFDTSQYNSLNSDGLLFWFPKNKYIIERLPLWAQNDLIANPGAFSWDMRSKRKYVNQKKLYSNTIKDNDVITLIDSGKFIRLEQNQLAKLGFVKDNNNQIEYKIKAKNYLYHEYFEDNVHYINMNCKSEKAYLNAKENTKFPVPLYVSDSVIGSFTGNVNYLLANKNDETENELKLLLRDKSKLIPIQIKIDRYKNTYYWYSYDNFLMDILNNDQKKLAENILKDSTNNKNIVLNLNSINEDLTLEDIYTVDEKKFSGLNPLRLSYETLEKMGFKNQNNNLEITVYDTINKAVKLTLFKHGVTIDNTTIDSAVKNNLMVPDYISDDLGKHTYVSFKTNAEKNATLINFKQLIPVLFETNRSYNAIDLFSKGARPNYILWFKPSEEFLNLLPDTIKNQIENELDCIQKGPCVYTDICKENKVNILNINAYPNPSAGKITLKVEFLNQIPYTYSIADMSGKTILNKHVAFNSESKEIEIDVSALDNGIYYLYVYTDMGDLFVEKIVVMK